MTSLRNPEGTSGGGQRQYTGVLAYKVWRTRGDLAGSEDKAQVGKIVPNSMMDLRKKRWMSGYGGSAARSVLPAGSSCETVMFGQKRIRSKGADSPIL